MTRWAIVADLNRCVGCQTCTSACKHANATAPGIQWRKVLDFETGEFPNVSRAFVPVGCMHCDEPPCLDVCPSTATQKRADGIVTIDYDLCIGCAYCVMACPYQARSRVDVPNKAYGTQSMQHEKVREQWERQGVSQKCTLCIDRIDPGLAQGLKPGIDPEATPACINSCIADALHFGDISDPDSNVSKLLKENKHFRMHEDLGTGPGFYYLWERGSSDDTQLAAPDMLADPVGLKGVAPKLQKSWDWRAAANFILGGTGAGLFAVSALAGLLESPALLVGLLALVLVSTGLFCVWLEIGRPWRFINVYFHARRSWMTREAIAAIPFLSLGGLALLVGWEPLWLVAAAFGLLFLYCQGKILQASKGIPAWRQEDILALIVITGLVEGAGLFVVLALILGLEVASFDALKIGFAVLIGARYLAWWRYRKALGKAGAPTETFKKLDAGYLNLTAPSQALVFGIVVISLFVPALLGVGGLLALLTGWKFKYTLITRAAYNQGYEIVRMPSRGAGKSSPGVKPGWEMH
jgi:phenylacetyl-CoA:acceptor oxidoreductase subunit 1